MVMVLSVQLRGVPGVLSLSPRVCLPLWSPGWSSGLPDHLLFPQQSWEKGANFRRRIFKDTIFCICLWHWWKNYRWWWKWVGQQGYFPTLSAFYVYLYPNAGLLVYPVDPSARITFALKMKFCFKKDVALWTRISLANWTFMPWKWRYCCNINILVWKQDFVIQAWFFLLLLQE